MLRITLTKPGEPARTKAFDKREITVGRTAANDVEIPEPGVSSSHARIINIDGELTLIDLESTNGTFVNGARIQGPHVLRPGDEVYICAHRLEFELPQAASLAYGHAPSLVPGPALAAAGPGGSPFGDKRPGQPTLPPLLLGGFPSPPPSPPVVSGGFSTPTSMPPVLAGAPPEPLRTPSIIVDRNAQNGQPAAPAPYAPSSPTPPPAFDPPAFDPPAFDPHSFDPHSFDPPALVGQPAFQAQAPQPLPGQGPTSFNPGPPSLPTQGPPSFHQGPPSFPGQPPSLLPGSAEPSAVGPPPRMPTRFPGASPEPLSPVGPSSRLPTPFPAVQAQPPAFAEREPPALVGPSARLPTPYPEPPAPSDSAPTHAHRPSRPPIADLPPSLEPMPVRALDPSPPPPAWSPPAAPAPDTYPPGLGLSRPAPVSMPSPIALSGAEDGLGDLNDLAALSPDDQLHEACARVFGAVRDRLAPPGRLLPSDDDTRQRVRARTRALLTKIAERYRSVDPNVWTDRITDELVGLGRLAPVLTQADVHELFLHGPRQAFVRKRHGGPPQPFDLTFTSPQALETVVRRLTRTWFGIDHPVVDVRTSDGTDVYAVHESLATGGPIVKITPLREPPQHSLEQLLTARALSPAIANLLSACVQGGLNVGLCASPGADAHAFLMALADAAPQHERKVVVRPSHRPAKLPPGTVVLDGGGMPSSEQGPFMQALVRTALGLAPDRLYVLDVSGPETADVLATMGRGLHGCALAVRASSTQEGLVRLATLSAVGAVAGDLGTRIVDVAQSLELLIGLARFPDGQTRVVQVSEPSVQPTGQPQCADLIRYDARSRTWVATGVTPTFFHDLQRRGIAVDLGSG